MHRPGKHLPDLRCSARPSQTTGPSTLGHMAYTFRTNGRFSPRSRLITVCAGTNSKRSIPRARSARASIWCGHQAIRPRFMPDIRAISRRRHSSWSPPQTSRCSTIPLRQRDHTDTTPKAERADYYDVGVSQVLADGFTIGLDSFYKASHNLIDEGQFGAPIILTPFNYQVRTSIRHGTRRQL